jgi:hypothetical protein
MAFMEKKNSQRSLVVRQTPEEWDKVRESPSPLYFGRRRGLPSAHAPWYY